MLLPFQLTSAFFLLSWAGAGRIIGGREAKPHSRPYMAFIKIENAQDAFHCGGFLIRADVVVSAAHCVVEKGRIRITVILGAHNVDEQEQSQQVITVDDFVIHPRYSSITDENDIVLLKLKKKARMTKEVAVVPLTKWYWPVAIGTKCTVAGWGMTSVSGHMSNVLMEVDLEVKSEKICKDTFKYIFLPQSMICAGDQSGKKATFKGDSGGPLVCNKKVHGIVSYGPINGLFPEVFTKVSYFEPWIREHLRRFVLQDLPKSLSSQ